MKNIKIVVRAIAFTVALLIVLSMVIMLTGCNKQVLDTTWKFDRAIITLPNGETVEGKVDSWKDFDGDQIQVKIDGVSYLVHSENVVLIAD